MPGWLAAPLAHSPALAALRCGDVQLSFAELDRVVRRATAWLRVRGVRAGDRVGLLLPNGVELVALVHAAQRCGAVLVPLNTRLTARELAFQLRDSSPRLLVHGDGALADVARDACGGAVEPVPVPTPLGDGEPGADGPPSQVDLGDTAAIAYTSGTSGVPKGAELSHGAFLWSAVGAAFAQGVVPGDRWLACLPLFHVGGLAILYRGALAGAAVTLHERFEPMRVTEELEHGGITLVSLVANMLERVLDARGDRPAPTGLRCVLLGGGPAPRELVARARRLGFPIATTYGLTETASQVATLPLALARTDGDAVGRALFANELRILSPDGVALSPGEPGEIAVRGPTVMKGYLCRPAETAEALRGGWLHTGDVGTLDEQGFLRVLDRRSDLIVSGGENVYPAEVEAALREHPAVGDAGVAGEPDPRFGRRVAAWVVLRPAARASGPELDAFCRARIAGYKVPRAFHFVRELPRAASGKLLRRALAAP
jgi:O-succinylbenzoic acid--CoA ligase